MLRITRVVAAVAAVFLFCSPCAIAGPPPATVSSDSYPVLARRKPGYAQVNAHDAVESLILRKAPRSVLAPDQIPMMWPSLGVTFYRDKLEMSPPDELAVEADEAAKEVTSCEQAFKDAATETDRRIASNMLSNARSRLEE